MAVFDAFIGPSYTAQSANVDCENSMNLYAEAIEGGGTGKAKIVLYGTPGLTAYFTLPTAPVRCLWSNASRLFAVGGSKLYEVFGASAGTVNATSLSTTVTWASGDRFNGNWPSGTPITINGVSKVISSVTDGTHLIMTTTAGISGAGSGVPYTKAISTDLRGDVGNDGNPAEIFSNGNQILIISNGIAYCDNGAGPIQPNYGSRSGNVNTANVGAHSRVSWIDGDLFDASMVGQPIVIGGVTYTVSVFTNPTLIETTTALAAGPLAYTATYPVYAATGAFLDTYFIVAAPESKQFNFSAINDGTTWDPLDYASKSAYPDNILAMLADHEELWLQGTDTTEIFQNTGAALNPLTRIAGALIHHGLAARFCRNRLQNGVAWLSSDPARGGAIAYLAQGFTPNRISTHAVETVWSGYSTIADAVSFTYTDRGHEFWVITFPTANATWVFDATSGWWHPRGWWNGSSIDRQRQMFHAYAFGSHIVGDWQTGALYVQSLTALSDAGTSIHRIRTAPHLSTEQLWNFYNRFQLDMEVGQSTSTPSVSLDWSDDGGHTFHAAITTTPTVATYAGRVVWRRLGRSRDRVWRITITDAVAIALIRAILDVEQGNA